MRPFPAIIGLALLAAPARAEEGAPCSITPEETAPAPRTAKTPTGPRHRQHEHDSPESARRRGAHMMLLRRLLLDKYDRNGDDLIDGEERRLLLRDALAAKEKALRDLIARFDKDGDGKLNAEELGCMQRSLRPAARLRPARTGPPGSPPPAPQAIPPPPPDAGPLALLTQQLLLEVYDTDRDGKLSETERRAIDADASQLFEERTRELLARFDQNGDGRLDRSERERARRLLREERELGREIDAASPPPDPIDIYLDTFYDRDVIHALGDQPEP